MNHIGGRIRELTDGFPIVMHGGSGVSEEDYRRCIEAGVRKINYFTYMDKAGGSAAKAYAEGIEDGKPVFFSDIIKTAQEAMEADVERTLRVFAHL